MHINLNQLKQHWEKVHNEPRHDEWVKQVSYVKNLLSNTYPELKKFLNKNSKTT